MRVWIFSDLHLTNSGSSLYRAFLKTLAIPSDSNDVIVFSGDIFDLMVGNSSYFKEKFGEFFEAVTRLSLASVGVHYIEGNHDFHLRDLFPSSVIFHEDSVVLEDKAMSPPQKLYIAHGDLVDKEDQQYLRLRRFFRSKPIQVLSRILPGQWIERIGSRLSRPADQKARDLPESWDPEKRAKLRVTFRKFAHQKGNDFVILGHCHDLDQLEPYYFNMGYPPVHGKYLYYETPSVSELAKVQRREFGE